jgi:hypothetical protein
MRSTHWSVEAAAEHLIEYMRRCGQLALAKAERSTRNAHERLSIALSVVCSGARGEICVITHIRAAHLRNDFERAVENGLSGIDICAARGRGT